MCEAMTYSQEHVASVLDDVCFSFTDTDQLYVFLEHFMFLFVHHTWASPMGGKLKASFPVSRCYISFIGNTLHYSCVSSFSYSCYCLQHPETMDTTPVWPVRGLSLATQTN